MNIHKIFFYSAHNKKAGVNKRVKTSFSTLAENIELKLEDLVFLKNFIC